MRGEDGLTTWRRSRRSGSPPHARGRPFLSAHAAGHSRITPACAGKTIVADGWSMGEPDHPRMRGEDCRGRRRRMVAAGSPPHARGRLEDWVGKAIEGRITPACAGKTRQGICKTPLSPDHPRMRGEDL